MTQSPIETTIVRDSRTLSNDDSDKNPVCRCTSVLYEWRKQ